MQALTGPKGEGQIRRPHSQELHQQLADSFRHAEPWGAATWRDPAQRQPPVIGRRQLWKRKRRGQWQRQRQRLPERQPARRRQWQSATASAMAPQVRTSTSRVRPCPKGPSGRPTWPPRLSSGTLKPRTLLPGTAATPGSPKAQVCAELAVSSAARTGRSGDVPAALRRRRSDARPPAGHLAAIGLPAGDEAGVANRSRSGSLHAPGEAVPAGSWRRGPTARPRASSGSSAVRPALPGWRPVAKGCGNAIARVLGPLSCRR